FEKSAGWRAYRNLRAQLLRRRFDLLLHMQVSLRANIASLCIPAEVRLGFDRARARNYQRLFTTYPIDGSPRVHVVDGFFQFLETAGINDRVMRWDIPLSTADREFAANQLIGGGPALIISPCSSQRWRNYRNWSAESYAAVVDYANMHYNAQVVLTGAQTPMEQAYSERICELARYKPRNLVGQTTLKRLLALIERAAAVIAPDSAPAHMATAVNTPVIGIYATANPKRSGPYLSQQWVVDKYPEAVRLEFGKSVDDIPWGKRVRNPQAMQLPQVADVTHKLDQLLGSH
ncbi:MAG: glycosyltransferase family 9 protein, partial [Acidiferrobacterales bacterium]